MDYWVEGDLVWDLWVGAGKRAVGRKGEVEGWYLEGEGWGEGG